MIPNTAERQAMTIRLRPDRSEFVDVAFAAALCAAAVTGLRSGFAGNEELIVGLPAVVVGCLAGFVFARLRWPFVLGLAAAVVLFAVLAPPVALAAGGGSFVPTPDALADVVDGLVNGWYRLLTTLPPAGDAGNLVMVPYTCGFVGAVLTVALAMLKPVRLFCLLPPTAILALAIAVGVDEPSSALIQGGLFAVVAIAWVALRTQRRRAVVIRGRQRKARTVSALALLAIAAAAGLTLGANLPGVSPEERFLLRDRVDPPFDPQDYASPLVGFRQYPGEEAPLHDTVVMRVTGLPEGARIRLGVLDDYDGLVWRATGDGAPGVGTYQRVGSQFPSSSSTATRIVSIEVGALDDVWVPATGSVSSLSFGGSRSTELAESFRFNLDAGVGAVTVGLREGDRIELTASFPAVPEAEDLGGAALDQRVAVRPVALPPEVAGLAADLLDEGADGATDPYSQVAGLAELLRAGAFSNGGAEAVPVTPPGHSLVRLARFMQAAQFVGNGEQYASAAALILRSRGIPARVVMGFAPSTDGDGLVEVVGDDVEAWVEVPFEGAGWVPFDVTPPEENLPQPIVEERRDREQAESQPPPPTTLPPPAAIGDDLLAENAAAEERRDDGSDRGLLALVLRIAPYAAVPLAAILIPAAIVVLLKALRRRRRRTFGPESRRIGGGWSEVLDLALDLGRPVPPRSTRLEAARLIGTGSAPALALQTDVAIFGPEQPTGEDVDSVWREMQRVRQSMLEGVGRVDRLRAAVSLTSLRRSR